VSSHSRGFCRKFSFAAHVEYHQQRRRVFINADGFHITPACRTYLTPLIQGEAYPPFKDGLSEYVTLTNRAVRKKLPSDFTL